MLISGLYRNRSLKIWVCDRSDLLSVSLHSATQGKICEFKREFSANVVFTNQPQASL
jgi:hypothetical protein